MFTTYGEPTVFPFCVPNGTYRICTTVARTSRSVTESLQRGWFNAGQSTPLVYHVDNCRGRSTSTEVDKVAEGLPFTMVLGGQQYCPHQAQHEPMDIDVPQLLRRNYKRPWEYEPHNVEPKRFRPETGSGHIHYERENMKTCEVDQMQHPWSSISLSTTGHKYQSYFLPVDKSSSINGPGCKYISSSNKSKSNKSDMEYEKMLFETHGCTVYHHQRTQLLDNDHIETEF